MSGDKKSMLGWRCPECGDELIEHKDAACIHTWIQSLLAQMRYVEIQRDYWKRQYDKRQIEDASGYKEALEAIRCNSEPNTLFNFLGDVGDSKPAQDVSDTVYAMYAGHIKAINTTARAALRRTIAGEGKPDCPVCCGRGWYESWNDCICGACPPHETVMCRCHSKYVAGKTCLHTATAQATP